MVVEFVAFEVFKSFDVLLGIRRHFRVSYSPMAYWITRNLASHHRSSARPSPDHGQNSCVKKAGHSSLVHHLNFFKFFLNVFFPFFLLLDFVEKPERPHFFSQTFLLGLWVHNFFLGTLLWKPIFPALLCELLLCFRCACCIYYTWWKCLWAWAHWIRGQSWR